MPARLGLLVANAAARCAAVVRAALRGESLWLFLFAWAALGCFVNTRDQVTWNLQHAWVESLAERGTMYVDGSATPRFALERLGDTWAAPDGVAERLRALGLAEDTSCWIPPPGRSQSSAAGLS